MPTRFWRPAVLLTALAAAPLSGATTTPVPSGATPTTVGTPPPPAAPIDPAKASYDVGLVFGAQLEHAGLGNSVSLSDLERGLRDALAGQAVGPDVREAANRFLRDGRDAVAAHNRALAKDFLASNAHESGVVALPSGLQYRVLAPGDEHASSPRPTDQVTVRYRASLPDGREFDRSDTHGAPATFRVGSVFKGWQEAFQAMKPGAKWQLFVPPDLGYGNNTPPGVPPGSLVIYEIELLKVEGGPVMDPATAQHRPPAAAGAPKAAAPAAH